MNREETLVECPNCGTRWELDEKDTQSPQITCDDCKTVFNVQESITKERENTVLLLTKRYQNAYLVANTTNAIGSFIKGIGILLGVIICVAAFVGGSKIGTVVGVVGVIGGIVVGCFIAMFGVLICALGQVLRATLDVAVNTSPLLSTSERTEITSV